MIWLQKYLFSARSNGTTLGVFGLCHIDTQTRIATPVEALTHWALLTCYTKYSSRVRE